MQKLKILIPVAIILFSRCAMDWKADVAVVKNYTSSRLLIAKQPQGIMTDSVLCLEQFSESWVEANQSQLITLPNIDPSSQADSVKCYLYVFNCDTLDKYKAKEKIRGLVEQALIKKIEIQLNCVKQPLDTIYIK